MSVVLGFTGTRRGLTPEQAFHLAYALRGRATARAGELRLLTGLCVGADEEAAELARAFGYLVEGLPARGVDPALRSALVPDLLQPERPPLERNHVIVERGEELLAAPGEEREVLRSGTWATIRYARRIEKPHAIFWPSGRVTRYDGKEQPWPT